MSTSEETSTSKQLLDSGHTSSLSPRSDPGGPLSRAGRYLDDHIHSFLTTTGVLLTGLGGAEMSITQAIWPRVIFGAGATISILGVVQSTRRDRELHGLRSEVARLRSADPRQVFFLAAALSDDWQVELEHSLLSEIGRCDFAPVSWVTGNNFSCAEQADALERIVAKAGDYVGGFIVIAEPEHRQGEFRDFAKRFRKPVVFVDNAPFAKDEQLPPRCSFVGVDSASGGRLAAEAALELSSRSRIQSVLVIASNTQLARQQEFRSVLIAADDQVSVVIDTDGGFDRAKAREVATRHLIGAMTRKAPIDLVFCTSDAMTMGCLDAIENLSSRRDFARPQVIGYDGIRVTKHIAVERPDRIARVVVQDAHEVAVRALSALKEMLAHPELNVLPVWIEPHLYPAVHLGHASQADRREIAGGRSGRKPQPT